MTTISIIGAGSLGSSLARELITRDVQTQVISRGDAHRELPGSVGHIRTDARDPEALAKVIAGSDIVIHTAQPAYHRWAEEFPELQRGIIDAVAATSAKLVIADNLYMYGRGDHGTITDTTPEAPCSAKGRVRKSMAHEALRAHAEGRIQIALTRPSNYVGADYELTRSLLTGPAKAGKALKVLGGTDQPHSFSYVPDVARAMADIALADDAYGRPWILPAMSPVTQRELCDRIWAAAGNEGAAKIQAIRGTAMKAIGLFNPALRASAEMMYEFDEPFIVKAEDFQRRFGWGATPLADAIEGSVATARR